MPGIDEVPIIVDLVLVLTGVLEVPRVDAFHADEGTAATRASRLFHEVLDLVRLYVHLDHEPERNPLFLA